MAVAPAADAAACGPERLEQMVKDATSAGLSGLVITELDGGGAVAGYPGSKWCDEYDADEWEDVKRDLVGSEYDTGATGQTASAVDGITEADEVVSSKVATDVLDTPVDVGEASQVDAGELLADEALGVLPEISIAGALPWVATVATVGYLGWTIGEGIDEWIGIGVSRATISASEEIYNISYGGTSLYKIPSGHDGCDCWTALSRSEVPTPEFVELPSTAEYVYEHSNYVNLVSQEGWGSSSPLGPHWLMPARSEEAEQQSSKMEYCQPEPVEGGWREVYNCEPKLVGKRYASVAYLTQWEVAEDETADGFPRVGMTDPCQLGDEACVSESEAGHMEAPASVTGAPLPKLANASEDGEKITPGVPVQVTSLVIHEDPSTTTGSPSPLAPRIPAYTEDENANQYRQVLEVAGWTNVTVTYVGEIAENAKIGPEDVIGVDPAVGAETSYTAPVTVDANPADTVQSSAEGGGYTAPEPPGIKFPEVPTPCKAFPFGIPCWVVEQGERMVAPAKAPVFRIPLPRSIGGSIELNLAIAEPLMEILRPVLAFLGCIGLVLLFGRFASSSAGSSGGGGGDGDESP